MTSRREACGLRLEAGSRLGAAAVIAAAALAAPVWLSAQAPVPAELRWGGDAEGGAPFVEADPRDPSKLEGFDVEIAEVIARGLGRAPRFVRNVRGYGYAFSGDARIDEAPVATTREAVAAATMWVEWGERRFPLADGENVIGRDARAHVALDDASVSRRHARLIVDGATARLEDLGSRNGTYARNERLVQPLEMRDGLAFRVGRLTLIFRTLAVPGSTADVAR